jgi:hypothetical protein
VPCTWRCKPRQRGADGGCFRAERLLKTILHDEIEWGTHHLAGMRLRVLGAERGKANPVLLLPRDPENPLHLEEMLALPDAASPSMGPAPCIKASEMATDKATTAQKQGRDHARLAAEKGAAPLFRPPPRADKPSGVTWRCCVMDGPRPRSGMVKCLPSTQQSAALSFPWLAGCSKRDRRLFLRFLPRP